MLHDTLYNYSECRRAVLPAKRSHVLEQTACSLRHCKAGGGLSRLANESLRSLAGRCIVLYDMADAHLGGFLERVQITLASPEGSDGPSQGPSLRLEFGKVLLEDVSLLTLGRDSVQKTRLCRRDARTNYGYNAPYEMGGCGLDSSAAGTGSSLETSWRFRAPLALATEGMQSSAIRLKAQPCSSIMNEV